MTNIENDSLSREELLAKLRNKKQQFRFNRASASQKEDIKAKAQSKLETQSTNISNLAQSIAINKPEDLLNNLNMKNVSKSKKKKIKKHIKAEDLINKMKDKPLGDLMPNVINIAKANGVDIEALAEKSGVSMEEINNTSLSEAMNKCPKEVIDKLIGNVTEKEPEREQELD